DRGLRPGTLAWKTHPPAIVLSMSPSPAVHRPRSNNHFGATLIRNVGGESAAPGGQRFRMCLSASQSREVQRPPATTSPTRREENEPKAVTTILNWNPAR